MRSWHSWRRTRELSTRCAFIRSCCLALAPTDFLSFPEMEAFRHFSSQKCSRRDVVDDVERYICHARACTVAKASRAHTKTHTQKHTHARTHTHTYTYTHTHTSTHTHTYTYTHTHTHAHTHMGLESQARSRIAAHDSKTSELKSQLAAATEAIESSGAKVKAKDDLIGQLTADVVEVCVCVCVGGWVGVCVCVRVWTSASLRPRGDLIPFPPSRFFPSSSLPLILLPNQS